LTGEQHPPGIRFAINSDIAMFQVYTSPRTGVGANVVLGQGSFNVVACVSNKPPIFVVVHSSEQQLLYSIVTLSKDSTVSVLRNSTLLPLPSKAFSVTVDLASSSLPSESFLFLANARGQFVTYILDRSSSELQLNSHGCMQLNDRTLLDLVTIPSDSIVSLELSVHRDCFEANKTIIALLSNDTSEALQLAYGHLITSEAGVNTVQWFKEVSLPAPSGQSTGKKRERVQVSEYHVAA
jgi:hypothetical protein